MSDQNLDNVEIEPLSDEALEEVAGGAMQEDAAVICSWDDCSNG